MDVEIIEELLNQMLVNKLILVGVGGIIAVGIVCLIFLGIKYL